MMTFEEWFHANYKNEEILNDPESREIKEDEYRFEMKAEPERVKRFGKEFLEEQREELRGRVNEVLRILADDELSHQCRRAWLYTEIGEIEYAQFITILPERTANNYKDELFGAWEEAKKRETIPHANEE